MLGGHNQLDHENKLLYCNWAYCIYITSIYDGIALAEDTACTAPPTNSTLVFSSYLFCCCCGGDDDDEINGEEGKRDSPVTVMIIPWHTFTSSYSKYFSPLLLGRAADQIRMEFFRMIGGGITVEQMPFQLVRREENFEIRDYEQVVVAETVDDGNSGFRTLARYIGVFGTPENRVRGTDRDPTNPKKKLL